MATYKQPCIHCGEMIERDSRVCPRCASRSPFGYQCPHCFKEIQKGYAVCSGCGRPLTVQCPHCARPNFIANEKCGDCGLTLLIRCENKRCGELQFFEITKCTACGKPIKNGMKQLKNGVK